MNSKILIALVFFIAMFLGIKPSAAQIPAPYPTISGQMAANGNFPMLLTGSVVFSSDADRTLVYPETVSYSFTARCTTSLTAQRNMIAPLIQGTYTVKNTCSQSIQMIGSTGAGAVIPSGSTATIYCDGSNYTVTGISGTVLLAPLSAQEIIQPGATPFSVNMIVPTTSPNLPPVLATVPQEGFGGNVWYGSNCMVTPYFYTGSTASLMTDFSVSEYCERRNVWAGFGAHPDWNIPPRDPMLNSGQVITVTALSGGGLTVGGTSVTGGLDVVGDHLSVWDPSTGNQSGILAVTSVSPSPVGGVTGVSVFLPGSGYSIYTASVSAFTGSSGTLTFTTSTQSPLLFAGEPVILSGFTSGNAGLNQTVVVLSAGLSSTSFQAVVTGSGYSSAAGTISFSNLRISDWHYSKVIAYDLATTMGNCGSTYVNGQINFGDCYHGIDTELYRATNNGLTFSGNQIYPAVASGGGPQFIGIVGNEQLNNILQFNGAPLTGSRVGLVFAANSGGVTGSWVGAPGAAISIENSATGDQIKMGSDSTSHYGITSCYQGSSSLTACQFTGPSVIAHSGTNLNTVLGNDGTNAFVAAYTDNLAALAALDLDGSQVNVIPSLHVNGNLFVGSSFNVNSTTGAMNVAAITSTALTSAGTECVHASSTGLLSVSGADCGTASSIAFSGVTTGTNTTPLLIGTGGSLGTSGSGAIIATAVPASGITGTTLASSVTASSLISVGTSLSIGTGATPSGVTFQSFGTISLFRNNATASANSTTKFLGGTFVGGTEYSTILDEQNTSGSNVLNWGGGTSSGEPATQHVFYIGAAGTAGAGTAVLNIQSTGLNLGSGNTVVLSPTGLGSLATGSTVNGSLICTAAGVTGCYSLGGTLSNTNIVAGAGAGAGATASVTGLDGTHQLSITTAGVPSATATLATLTFTATRGHTAYCILSPTGGVTALLTGTSLPTMNALGATSYSITSGSVALTTGTTYTWFVSCP